ncbi:hypothetical protein [uncultured Croceitalea sp.]|uniref:hypothetical protein n=1 Tax=uncultured Croceitalea sp. TaxID=1798908 RepID=UPI0033068206
MKYRIFILTIINFILVLSCESDDTNLDLKKIQGFYKIDKIYSDQEVDLNGDAVRSTNLKREINDYFNNLFYDLEIRPNYTNKTDTELITLSYPQPNLSFDYPSQPDGFIEYARQGISFHYKLVDNTFIFDANDEFIKINKLELLQPGNVIAHFSKIYYDFSTQNWTEIKIIAIYKRQD